MDREKLIEAIRRLRDVHLTCPEEQRIVCDAAEAYLASLPRRVEVTRYAIYRGNLNDLICTMDDPIEAAKLALEAKGNFLVTLTGTASVPA